MGQRFGNFRGYRFGNSRDYLRRHSAIFGAASFPEAAARPRALTRPTLSVPPSSDPEAALTRGGADVSAAHNGSSLDSHRPARYVTDILTQVTPPTRGMTDTTTAYIAAL